MIKIKTDGISDEQKTTYKSARDPLKNLARGYQLLKSPSIPHLNSATVETTHAGTSIAADRFVTAVSTPITRSRFATKF